jgi:hypothetical protein
MLLLVRELGPQRLKPAVLGVTAKEVAEKV